MKYNSSYQVLETGELIDNAYATIYKHICKDRYIRVFFIDPGMIRISPYYDNSNWHFEEFQGLISIYDIKIVNLIT